MKFETDTGYIVAAPPGSPTNRSRDGPILVNIYNRRRSDKAILLTMLDPSSVLTSAMREVQIPMTARLLFEAIDESASDATMEVTDTEVDNEYDRSKPTPQDDPVFCLRQC